MACNWLMMTSSGDNNWPKELRNGLQLADDDIIRGGLDIVTDKKKINRRQSKKPPSLWLRGLKMSRYICMQQEQNNRYLHLLLPTSELSQI